MPGFKSRDKEYTKAESRGQVHLHMTEAHNMALHTQSPYTKNSALTPQKKNRSLAGHGSLKRVC